MVDLVVGQGVQGRQSLCVPVQGSLANQGAALVDDGNQRRPGGTSKAGAFDGRPGLGRPLVILTDDRNGGAGVKGNVGVGADAAISRGGDEDLLVGRFGITRNAAAATRGRAGEFAIAIAPTFFSGWICGREWSQDGATDGHDIRGGRRPSAGGVVVTVGSEARDALIVGRLKNSVARAAQRIRHKALGAKAHGNHGNAWNIAPY